MKKALFLASILSCSLLVFSQNQVSWSCTSKKIDKLTYEVRMTAIIEEGWHIYSQKQPQKAIITPTAFDYTKSPLITVVGKPKEEGEMVTKTYENLEFQTNVYHDTVSFVQKVTLAHPVKTNLEVKVTYQTCTDHNCMPPETSKFSIMLQ